MEHIFWLEEGKVAGRCGPDNYSWNPSELAEHGFSAIISVNDGEHCNEDEISASGLAYACIPLSKNSPPIEGDREICLIGLPKALSFIKTHLATGKVLIHCYSGKDRTGVLMAYYLFKEHDMTIEQAMDHVWSVRSIAFSAPGWVEHCRSILDAC